jgi:transcriptional regulator with XRE-family HTH domain
MRDILATRTIRSRKMMVSMPLLRKVREQNGWSRDHLAAMTGVDSRTIQRIEQGEVLLSLQTGAMLATALGVPLTDLIQYSGLGGRLRMALMRCQQRAPTRDELAALPNDLWPLVASFCEAVAGLNADEETMKSIEVELESLHRQAMELLEKNDQAWSNIRGCADRETTLPLVAEMGKRSAALRQNSDRASRAWRRLQEIFERHTSQAAAMGTVGSLLDAGLNARCERA